MKSGKRPPSEKLVVALQQYLHAKRPNNDYVEMFIQSRKTMGCSDKTIAFYAPILSSFKTHFDCTKATRQGIERYLNQIPPSNGNLCNRHAYYRTLRAFYNWASKEYGINSPMGGIRAPILSKVILPALNVEQVSQLIEKADNTRDKAIISTFVESGLRLSELASIRLSDIDFEAHTIRVIGKGRKEAYAPFGAMAESYLKQLLIEQPRGGSIWGITKWGIVLMLKRLEHRTGIQCNAHVFRRSFATILRKLGVDSMVIKELGRWESTAMVQRYTRSFSFQDSMKFYKSPLDN